MAKSSCPLATHSKLTLWYLSTVSSATSGGQTSWGVQITFLIARIQYPSGNRWSRQHGVRPGWARCMRPVRLVNLARSVMPWTGFALATPPSLPPQVQYPLQ